MFSVDSNKLKIENIRQTDVKNESEWINITPIHFFNTFFSNWSGWCLLEWGIQIN